jgi:hypothetical protein
MESAINPELFAAIFTALAIFFMGNNGAFQPVEQDEPPIT